MHCGSRKWRVWWFGNLDVTSRECLDSLHRKGRDQWLEKCARRFGDVWPHCGIRAGVDGGLETWMPLVVDVLWIQCGGSGLTGVQKAGRDELVMCGLIAVEGLARTMVWKNWSQ